MSKVVSSDPDVLTIAKTKIARGQRLSLQIDISRLYDNTKLSIPVEVIRGQQGGPRLFISAAIHGDEINGVEIVRRILASPELEKLKGTLILVPVVNVFGFNAKSRYLPDRRDLNRSFPGRRNGSLASQLAYKFMKEIVSKCTHGIDLHTGANDRTNLPQIRGNFDDVETKELAQAFGVPVLMDSKYRDGSLREAAAKRKVKMLLYEGGESLRFNKDAIDIGYAGCFAIMKKIGMISADMDVSRPAVDSFFANDSYWVRAPRGGVVHALKKIGDRVKKDDVLAEVSDPLGRKPVPVIAPSAGLIIGMSQIPLMNNGDALFHVATFTELRRVKRAVDRVDDFIY